jgi:hypothetical protein
MIDELRAAQALPGFWSVDPALRRRLAERMGSLAVAVSAPKAPGAGATVEPTDSERAYGATGRVQLQGTRVDLGRLVFHRFGHGLPALLSSLRAAGCAKVRLGVTRETAQSRSLPQGEPFLDEGDD